MSDELELCPFCGGKAKLHKTTDGYSVVCSECEATTGVSRDKTIVIDDWNNRNKYKYVQLEHCPCCGGEAKLDSVICQGTRYYAIMCKDCYVGFKAYTDIAELIKAWNTRTDTRRENNDGSRAERLFDKERQGEQRYDSRA